VKLENGYKGTGDWITSLISHTGKFLGVVHCNSATVVRSLVGKQNQQPFCPILRVSKGSIFFKDDHQRKPKWTATRAFICRGLCDAAFAISNGTDLVVISLTENDLRFGHFSLPDKWMFRKLLFTNNGSTIFLLSRREGEERLDAFLVEILLLKRNHSEPKSCHSRKESTSGHGLSRSTLPATQSTPNVSAFIRKRSCYRRTENSLPLAQKIYWACA
jgi:hypothetical protein